MERAKTTRLAAAVMEPSDRSFICPECGGTEAGSCTLIQPREDQPGNPWSDVLQTIQCVRCRRNIPAHLAERGDGMPLKAARAEWRGLFRRRTTPYLTLSELVDLQDRLARYRATTPEDRAATSRLIIQLLARFPDDTQRPEEIAVLLDEHRRLTRFTWYREDVQIR